MTEVGAAASLDLDKSDQVPPPDNQVDLPRSIPVVPGQHREAPGPQVGRRNRFEVVAFGASDLETPSAGGLPCQDENEQPGRAGSMYGPVDRESGLR